jgi:hypothetical protein
VPARRLSVNVGKSGDAGSARHFMPTGAASGMALSPDDLDQVRQVVRSEMQQGIPPSFGTRNPARTVLFILLAAYLAVFVLHVLVIGGFTIYHLMHPKG